MTTIQLESVSKTYPSAAGAVSAVKDADLAVDAGELVAVVGKSGSGKSTLLHLVGAIDRPTSGSIVVSGTDLGALEARRLDAWRGRTVGFVFQFFQLLPTLTAAENVMLAMDFCGVVPPRDRRRTALGLLERVGLSREADRLPSALSGGQQQRVAIARALANDPPVLAADEPTGNLDSATAKEVLALFRAAADAGKAVLLATHERDIARLADRVVTMADGVLQRPAAPARAGSAR
jgi:putative ABC transport system ATP-binding protein